MEEPKTTKKITKKDQDFGKRLQKIRKKADVTQEELAARTGFTQTYISMIEVGLDYVEIGQTLDTLSGGESQRLKLASRLQSKGEFYILDEPTSGLHFADIEKLLHLLNRLVDNGNTVLVVEHNLDLIKQADWVIDLGPEGGEKGGEIMALGTPIDVSKIEESYTGRFLV